MTINQSINQSINQPNIFFATCVGISVKRITVNMLLFSRKLHVHVKFSG